MGLFGKKSSDDLGLDTDPLGMDDDMPPATPDSNADPFAQPPGGSQQPMNNPSSNHSDFSNPDINSISGSPKPREREDPPFMSSPAQQGAPASSNGGHVEKDLQIIIAKLDSVKSELDSLHQRVQRIERIAEADQLAREQKKQQQPYHPRW